MITNNISYTFLQNPFLTQFFDKLSTTPKPTRSQYLNFIEQEQQRLASRVDSEVAKAEFFYISIDIDANVDLLNIYVHTPKILLYSTEIIQDSEEEKSRSVIKILIETIRKIGENKVVGIICDNESDQNEFEEYFKVSFTSTVIFIFEFYFSRQNGF